MGAALVRREEAAVAVGEALARREEAVAGGEALAQREEAAGVGTPALREEAAVGGAPARCGAVTEEPGELGGPPVVVPSVSEAAAGQEVYVQPGAQ